MAIDRLAGDDARWTDNTLMDPSRSVGDGYAFLATALGSAPAHRLGVPAPDTLEDVLATQPSGLHTADRVAAALRNRNVVSRTDTSADQSYFPLHPEHLDCADGILFLHEV